MVAVRIAQKSEVVTLIVHIMMQVMAALREAKVQAHIMAAVAAVVVSWLALVVQADAAEMVVPLGAVVVPQAVPTKAGAAVAGEPLAVMAVMAVVAEAAGRR